MSSFRRLLAPRFDFYHQPQWLEEMGVLNGAESKHYISMIATAERRLARMVAEIAALPKEAEGTRLQTLGNEIIQAMQWKVSKLRSDLRLLHENGTHEAIKAAE